MNPTNISVFTPPYTISAPHRERNFYYEMGIMNALSRIRQCILRPINPSKYVHRIDHIRIGSIDSYYPTLDFFIDAVNQLNFDFLDFLETSNVRYTDVTLYDLMVMRAVAHKRKIPLDAFNRAMLRMLSYQRRSSWKNLAFTWMPPSHINRWEQRQRMHQFRLQQEYYMSQFARNPDVRNILFTNQHRF